jgi:hypothetical protein
MTVRRHDDRPGVLLLSDVKLKETPGQERLASL